MRGNLGESARFEQRPIGGAVERFIPLLVRLPLVAALPGDVGCITKALRKEAQELATAAPRILCRLIACQNSRGVVFTHVRSLTSLLDGRCSPQPPYFMVVAVRLKCQ